MAQPDRFELERHTDDPSWCWRVFDRETQRSYGWGMLQNDAEWLRDLLIMEAKNAR